MELETLRYAGERLRRAREEQNRSLASIAEATCITLKFLEGIEKGVPPKLPDTYIRAFIRAYAQQVGLDLAEVFPERHEAPPGPGQPPETPRVVVSDPATAAEDSPSRIPMRSRPASVLLVLSIVIVAGLVLSVFLIRQARRSPSVQEISFNQVIKEREGKMNQKAPAADTGALRNAPLAPAKPPDSLLLEGTAKDSVWVRVVADGARMKDYRLLPGHRIRAKAERYFTLSIGNANAIAFSLNGEQLGVLSPTKKPLWNVTLSRETMKKRQQSNVKSEQRTVR